MGRRERGALLAVLSALGSVTALRADETSLCLSSELGCLSPEGIKVQVRLGAFDGDCVGGQFLFRYDPAKLQLLDASPGIACDSTSPFRLEVFEDNDPVAGELFYAAGVNFLKGPAGSQGGTALACLSFAPIGGSDTSTDFCLLEGTGSRSTMLVNDQGHPVPIDNSVACPAGSPSILACESVAIESQCKCTPNTADCHALDTDCRVGVCNKTTHFCEVAPINEGGACDDGDPCTPVARCADGVCVGEGCTTSSLCPVSSSCLGLDSTLTVKVQLTAGDRVINGGQFSLRYDPTDLAFIDASPGSACDPASPFSSEVSELVDTANGEIFYAAGIALGATGTSGPATLACLQFLDLGEQSGIPCMFEGTNPFVTILADEFGQAVPPGSDNACPLVLGDPPTACVEFEGCRIPTVSEWGLITLTLLLLIGAKVIFARPGSSA